MFKDFELVTQVYIWNEDNEVLKNDRNVTILFDSDQNKGMTQYQYISKRKLKNVETIFDLANRKSFMQTNKAGACTLADLPFQYSIGEMIGQVLNRDVTSY